MSLLRITDLDVHYGDFQAIYGLNLSIDEGETLELVGRLSTMVAAPRRAGMPVERGVDLLLKLNDVVFLVVEGHDD